jgi:hypothetical protein
VISTVLVPAYGTVAVISFIVSTRCGHGGGTGAPATGTNDSISSTSDASTRPNASRPVSRARHRPLPQHLADRNAGIPERCPDGARLILADFRQHGLSGAIGEIGRRLIARKSRAFVGAPVANDDYEAALL